MKAWLQDNEGKYVVAEIFVIDRLDHIVNKYNNAYHSTVKMKHVDVKSSTYNGLDKETDKEDPKVKVGDHVRIWKLKLFFGKVYFSNCAEEVFLIKKVENTVLWTYVISDCNWRNCCKVLGKKIAKNKSKRV